MLNCRRYTLSRALCSCWFLAPAAISELSLVSGGEVGALKCSSLYFSCQRQPLFAVSGGARRPSGKHRSKVGETGCCQNQRFGWRWNHHFSRSCAGSHCRRREGQHSHSWQGRPFSITAPRKYPRLARKEKSRIFSSA